MSVYRALLELVLIGIVGVISVALLAKQRKTIHKRKGDGSSLKEWQFSWENESEVD